MKIVQVVDVMAPADVNVSSKLLYQRHMAYGSEWVREREGEWYWLSILCLEEQKYNRKIKNYHTTSERRNIFYTGTCTAAVSGSCPTQRSRRRFQTKIECSHILPKFKIISLAKLSTVTRYTIHNINRRKRKWVKLWWVGAFLIWLWNWILHYTILQTHGRYSRSILLNDQQEDIF